MTTIPVIKEGGSFFRMNEQTDKYWARALLKGHMKELEGAEELAWAKNLYGHMGFWYQSEIH